MDVFDLAAKISLDTSDYEKGIDKSKGLASKFGEGVGAMKGSLSSFKDVFKGTLAADIVEKGFSAVVNGAKQAGEGLFNLVKDASNAYGEYQQMVGGVEKLYGKSAKTLVNYAQNAYMTSGMSANEYMDTATQFSSSLINSLKGNVKEAASQTDVAMRAISDNVNVFGSNMDDVTNAYKGFARQNYTMLDNLKLGYAGSKAGMEQLIKDANEWGKANGKASNLSINSFSDVITAIQQIQEKQHIAGTTEKEAMSTLQGTANMTKMAWENVKTAIGGGGDLNSAIDNLITSIVGKGEGTGLIAQWTPTIEKAMNGIGQLIGQAAPIISQYLPELIQNTVPNLLSALGSMFSAIMEALPSLFEALKTSISESMTGVLSPESLIQNITDVISQVLTAVSGILPSLITILGNVAVGLVQGITQAAPQIIQAIVQTIQAVIAVLPQLLQAIVNALPTILPALIQGVTQLIVSIAQALPKLIQVIVQALPTIIKSVLDALQQCLPQIIKAVLELVTGIVKALPQIIQALTDALPEIIQMVIDTIIECLPMIITGLIQLIAAIVQALPQIISALIKAIPEIISAIIKAFKPLGQKLIEVGKDAVKKLWKGFKDRVSWIVKNVVNFAKSIPKDVKEQFNTIKDVGANLVKGLWKGINNKVSWVVEKVKGFGKKVLNALKDFFKIKSPSRVMRDQVGAMLAQGVAKGIEKDEKKAVTAATKMANKVLKSAKNVVLKSTDVSDALAKKVYDSIDKTEKKTVKKAETKTRKSGKTKTTTKNKSVTVKKSDDDIGEDYIKAGKNKVKALEDANKMSLQQEASFWVSVAKIVKNKSKVAYGQAMKLAAAAREKGQAKIYEKAEQKLQSYEETHTKTSAKYEATYWKKYLGQFNKGSKEDLKTRKNYHEALNKIDDERLQKYENFVNNYSALHNGQEMTQKAQMDYWEQATKKFKKGSDQWITAQNNFLSAQKSFNDSVKSAQDDLNSAAESAEKTFTDTLDDIADKVQQKTDSILQSLGNFYEKFDAGDPVDISALFDAQQSRKAAEDEGNQLLASLRDKLGADSPLYKELEEMGYQNGIAYWRAFNNMSAEQLKQYAENDKAIRDEATQEANTRLGPEIDKERTEAYKTYINSMQKAWDEYQTTLKDLGVTVAGFTIEFNKSLNAVSTAYVKALTGKDGMGATTADALEQVESEIVKNSPTIAGRMWSSGTDMMDSFIGGIKSKENDLQNVLNDLAKGIASFLGFSEPDKGPLSNFHTFAPDMIDLFTKGIKDNGHKIGDAFEDTLGVRMPDKYGTFTVKADDSTSASATGIGQILGVLQQYLPTLGNQQIVLDSGTLVGATVNQMNEQLAYVNNRRAGAFA